MDSLINIKRNIETAQEDYKKIKLELKMKRFAFGGAKEKVLKSQNYNKNKYNRSVVYLHNKEIQYIFGNLLRRVSYTIDAKPKTIETNKGYYYLFNYNTKGDLVSKTLVQDGRHNTQTLFKYKYDNKGRMIEMRSVIGKGYTRRWKYEYNGLFEIITETSSLFDTPIVTCNYKGHSCKLSYDDKVSITINDGDYKFIQHHDYFEFMYIQRNHICYYYNSKTLKELSKTMDYRHSIIYEYQSDGKCKMFMWNNRENHILKSINISSRNDYIRSKCKNKKPYKYII